MATEIADQGFRRWYVVILLCLLATMSYLDRYIIALLADPIIDALSIDATRIGLLIGIGFGLVYSIMGLPLAHLTDHGNRVRIVTAGVLIWSLATISSGFAPNFGLLLLSRTGVAIGEAVLVPAAISIIGDLFPAHKRTLPIALFMATSALMASGAFAIGGFAFQGAISLVPLSGMEPWRMTLILVGLPGLILAILWFMTVSEPSRRVDEGQAEVATIAALLSHIREHTRYYIPLFVAIALSGLGSYSFISWTSTMLTRSFDISIAEAGYYYGTIGLFAAASAALFWPAASAWFVRRKQPIGNIMLLASGLGMANALVASFLLWQSLGAMVVVIFLATFAYAAGGTLAVLIFQSAAPARMRARVISLYMLVGNLVGLTMGPAFSAWLSEQVFEGPDALRYSLGFLTLVLAPLVTGLIAVSARHYIIAANQIN